MADPFTPVFADFVRELSRSTGTGPFTPDEAVRGYRRFADAVSVGDSFHYAIQSIDRPDEYEYGRGTLQPDGTIMREPDGPATDFGPGSKTVSLVVGAEWFAAADHAMPVDVRRFGAKGDGNANDTAALQAAIDALSARYLADGKPRTLTFGAGTTYLVRQLILKPGVNLIGTGGATLKKTPAGAETNEAVLSTWVMVSAGWNSSNKFNSDAACAHRVRIEGLIFDGSLAEMNWTDGSYSQQQGHCLFLTGSNQMDSDRRAKFLVRACEFRGSVADGISVAVNADVIVEQVEAYNCFRGGLVATGGNSRLRASGFRGESARIDIEPISPGYGGSLVLDYALESVEIDLDTKMDVRWPNGGKPLAGIDLEVTPGSIAYLKGVRSHSPRFHLDLNGGGGEFLAEDCLFTLGPRAGDMNHLINLGDATFRNCEFRTVEQSGETQYAGLHPNPGSGSGCTMVFDRCRFSLDPAIRANTPGTTCRAFWPEYVAQADDIRFRFIEPEIVGDWHVGFDCFGCSTVEVVGGRYEADSLFRICGVSNHPCRLEIRGALVVEDRVSALFAHVNQANIAGNRLTFDQVSLSRALTTSSANPYYFDVVGSYSFPVDAKPTSTGAVRGTVAKLSIAPHAATGTPVVTEWMAVTTHASFPTWIPHRLHATKGSTAGRPAAAGGDTGILYFDTGLDPDGKPIWWTGSAWVDATGALA